jgi:hypothetical protein
VAAPVLIWVKRADFFQTPAHQFLWRAQGTVGTTLAPAYARLTYLGGSGAIFVWNTSGASAPPAAVLKQRRGFTGGMHEMTGGMSG